MHDSPAPRAVKITIIERFFISDDFIIASVSMGTTDGDIGEAFGDFTSSPSAKLPITKTPHKLRYGGFYEPGTAIFWLSGATIGLKELQNSLNRNCPTPLMSPARHQDCARRRRTDLCHPLDVGNLY